MWPWTVFLCLLIFYGHTSSQPVTDESENARQTRQLAFGECCPCPSAGQGFGSQESSMLTSDGSFARSRNVDDCPCRVRSPDSEGASSMFFPTSMRSDGNVVRPLDKKEDFKPLLHPEVDLASSVLQTLREATDEEYQDALARDASRNIAKAAEENIFRDAVPEASSGNIVTIIVNPKQADNIDDVIPQESHIQESRCIHAPLESGRTDVRQMRVAPKPPSLLREIFELPKISKPGGNVLDMDSGMGASNIQERVVHVDDDQVTNKSIQGLRKYAPLMKFDTNIKGKSTNMKSDLDDDSTVKKVPDFKLTSMKNKLKDLISNRSAIEGKAKLNSLPLIPKMRLNNSLSKSKEKNNEDLSLSPSNIQEQAKISFFQTKSHIENILQNTKPVGLKTLLKLKDVELIPLKDLVHKAAEKPTFNKPKFGLPAIFNKGDDVTTTNQDTNPINLAKTTKIIEKIPKFSKDEIIDHEVSPSNVVEQISENNCHKGEFKTTKIDGGDTEEEITLAEMINTTSSPSDIQSTVSDTSKDLANSQSNELPDNTDDCKIENLPVTEMILPHSIESSIDSETHGGNENELDDKTSKEVTSYNTNEEGDAEPKYVSSDEDCISNSNDSDSITDSSNNKYDVLKPTDTVLENIDDSSDSKNTVTEDSCDQELPERDHSKTLDSTSQTKLIKPLSLQNIIKKLENLRDPKTSSKNLNSFDRTPSNIIENMESSTIPDENLDSDCQNEESIQVTTVKSEICNDDTDDNNEPSDKVSMQDLQKISDSMLQKEEQERETKTLDCSEPLEDVTDPPNIPIEVNSREFENKDSEQFANSQNDVIMDPQNFVNTGDNNDNDIKNTCHTDIVPNNSLMQETDANTAASEVVIDRIPQSNDIIGSPLLLNKAVQPNEINFSLISNPIANIHDIKLAPIPTLDEMKLRLTNLFDKSVRDVEECTPSDADTMTDTSNVVRPIMSTDASTSSSQFELPPLRLEDVNLDILQLKPQPLFPKIPKLDLHSYKTKLPLPRDFLIKPIKLQSALKDEGSMVGATLSLGRNNPWESKPNLDNFGTRIKTKTQKITKTLRKPGALRSSLISSQGIGELSDTKSTLRSMQNTLESKFKGAIKKPVNLQNNDLLEVISRNHEDFNDKLKALHVDFNDRIETMRNNLFDKSKFGSGELSSTKSFSAYSNQNKDKKILLTPQPQSLASRRESKKTLKPRRHEQQRETEIRSLHRLPNERKFKMPSAASVPVPRTVEVPELKATLTKSPGLATQRVSSIYPNIQNTEALQAKQSSVALFKQASKELPVTNTRLEKSMNPFKNSKIKVSFSTTPRPPLPTRLQSRKISTPSTHSLTANLGKNTGFGQRQDHSGSPSELKHSIISSPAISSHLSHLDQHNLENYGLDNESRQTGASYDGPPQKLSGRVNLKANAQPRMSKDLKSWPKITESAFLSKVKEAVNARLSKANSPVTVKQADGMSVSSSVTENGEVLNSNTDMTRSASENIDIIEGQELKEHVSFKCTMVCSKE